MPRTLRTDHIATAAQAASPRILIIRRTTGWTSYFSTKLSCFAKRGARAVVQSCLCILSLRSEEHTSELQSNLVCRLLLEKKKNNNATLHSTNTQISTADRT